MSNRAQITRQAARDGVPAPTVERDYVLAHIIAGLERVYREEDCDEHTNGQERMERSLVEAGARPSNESSVFIQSM